ncbi:MAG: hypothetical protein WBN02_06835 [Sedimenticolaceae bacterium]
MPACKLVLIPIPVQYIADRPAVTGVFMTFGLQPAVDTEPGLGPVTDRTSLKRAVIATAVAAVALNLFFIIFWPSL